MVGWDTGKRTSNLLKIFFFLGEVILLLLSKNHRIRILVIGKDLVLNQDASQKDFFRQNVFLSMKCTLVTDVLQISE